MKTCISPFTKGSAGRVKFARPQTSGTRLFKELNFFGHTKTHICIHLWQKCAARRVPAVDLKGTWAIVCAAVDFSLLDVQHKEKIVPSKCSPDAAASFAVASMWKDMFMGKRVNKVKDPTFWLLEKAFPDDQRRQAVLQRCLFLPSTLFLQPSTPHFFATLQFQMSAALVTFDLKRYGGLPQQRLWVIIPKNTHIRTLT